jgi:hypothetical protein
MAYSKDRSFLSRAGNRATPPLAHELSLPALANSGRRLAGPGSSAALQSLHCCSDHVMPPARLPSPSPFGESVPEEAPVRGGGTTSWTFPIQHSSTQPVSRPAGTRGWIG